MGWLWAMSIPGLVVGLVVLAALERFGLWAGRRSWLPGRGRRTTTSLSGAGVEEFGAFFYAGKRDELEHRKTELVLPEAQTSGDRPVVVVDPRTGAMVLSVPATASATYYDACHDVSGASQLGT